MKIKVIVVNGVVDDVLCDEKGSDVQVDIVEVDKDEDTLITQYDNDDMYSVPFNIIHP